MNTYAGILSKPGEKAVNVLNFGMSHENHAQSTESAMVANGKTRLLQCSQFRQQRQI